MECGFDKEEERKMIHIGYRVEEKEGLEQRSQWVMGSGTWMGNYG